MKAKDISPDFALIGTRLRDVTWTKRTKVGGFDVWSDPSRECLAVARGDRLAALIYGHLNSEYLYVFESGYISMEQPLLQGDAGGPRVIRMKEGSKIWNVYDVERDGLPEMRERTDSKTRQWLIGQKWADQPPATILR